MKYELTIAEKYVPLLESWRGGQLVIGQPFLAQAVPVAGLDDGTEPAVPGDARARAQANAAFLASLDAIQLREAVLVFKFEHPEKAARLRALLLARAGDGPVAGYSGAI